MLAMRLTIIAIELRHFHEYAVLIIGLIKPRAAHQQMHCTATEGRQKTEFSDADALYIAAKKARQQFPDTFASTLSGTDSSDYSTNF